MPVIVLILAVFVAAVGPLDYILLGLARRRKWTWALFPCVCGGVTFGMFQLANHYLGTADHRSSVVFLDIGNDGKPVRKTQIEMLFAAREMDVTTELRNSLAVAWQPGSRYEGQVPGRYTMSQLVPQWSPQGNHETSFEPGETSPPFQWGKFTAAGYSAGNMRDLLPPGSAGTYFVSVFHGTGIEGSSGPLQNTFLREACVSGRGGLFQRVSQISPNAGRGMEDLPLLDTSDARQWLVAVVTRRGDDIIVYRKLYYANE